MHFDPVDVKEWAAEIKQYDSQRKQELRFDASIVPKAVTQKDQKAKQIEFHPLLQTYANPNRETSQREVEIQRQRAEADRKTNRTKPYMHEYNLVNLEMIPGISRPDEQEKIKQNILPSNFNDYNILTNQALDDVYFKNMRVVIEKKKKKEKPVINRNKRDYNIITNKFLQDDDVKQERNVNNNVQELEQRNKQTRVFNHVTGQYYDPQREADYQEHRRIQQLQHGKDFSQRFPPSWKFRESVYLDQTKEVPEEIIMIDQINHNKKKRYELRHVIEQEYRERDIEDQERLKERKQNYVKYDELVKRYDKGTPFCVIPKDFDIITLEKPKIDHIVKQFPNKPPQNTWEKVELTRNPREVQQGEEVRFYNEGIQEEVPKEMAAAEHNDIKGRLLQPQDPRTLKGAAYSSGLGAAPKPPSSSSAQAVEASKLPRIDPRERRESGDRKSFGSRKSQPPSQPPSEPQSQPPSQPRSLPSQAGSQDAKRIKTGGFFHQTVY